MHCLLSRVPKSANQRCGYSLRNAAIVDPELPACSSALFRSSFVPFSCSPWSSLPLDVSS